MVIIDVHVDAALRRSPVAKPSNGSEDLHRTTRYGVAIFQSTYSTFDRDLNLKGFRLNWLNTTW